MPIYEYECRDCGHRFEALQKISDAPLTDCPVCGKASVNKLVSASAFRLKGGGWYETDFKTGNRRHGTQEAGSGDAGKSSDAAGKTPARTDPKTDTKSGGKTDKKPDSKPAA